MSTPKSSQVPRALVEPPLGALVQSYPAMIAISLGIVVVLSFVAMAGTSKIPLANPPRWYQFTLSKRLEFLMDGRAIMSEARKRYGKQPYRLITDTGEVLILPPEYAVTIRNEMALSFGKAIEENFSGHVSGFEPFAALDHKKRLVQTVVTKHLTKSLNTMTRPLSNEATYALNVIFGNSAEWKETLITDDMLQLIARLSTKVFLGDEMCRNEAWLEASKTYTVASITMCLKMTAVPRALKFLVPWFSSEAKAVQKHLSSLRALLAPLIAQRAALKAEARKNGKPEPVFNDMIDWYEQESGGEAYDPAVYQSILSVAAIHTTSELLTHTLTLLASEPQQIEALREEIIRVLSAEGLTKAALANLKLVDSALKETQRFRPSSLLGMRRHATQPISLPNLPPLPAHTNLAIDASNMLDPDIHPSPNTYNIYRYHHMRRSPATAHKAHLVSTGPDNLTFGHGAQACPGRFFVANEVKIVLCHVLLKYDWELAAGACLESKHLFGDTEALDRGNRLRFRRRKEEINLDELAFV